MTYSQPRIGPSGSVSPQIQTARAQGTSGAVAPTLSENGKELDLREPEQAYRNEIGKNKGFDSLMTSLMEVGAPVAKRLNEIRQERGVSSLLQNEGAREILKQGGSQAHGLLWTYDEKYKDNVVAPIAGEAALQAKGEFEAAVAADPQLMSESWRLGATPEDWAKKWRDLEPASVRTLANLSAISPDGAKNAAVVYQTVKEGKKNEIRMQTVLDRVENNTVTAVAGVAVEGDASYDSWQTQLKANGATGGAVGDADWAVQNGEALGNAVVAHSDRFGVSPETVVVRSAQRSLEGMQEQLRLAREAGNGEGTFDFTEYRRQKHNVVMLLQAAKHPKISANGVSPFDRAGSEGASTMGKLTQEMDRVEAVRESVEEKIGEHQATETSNQLRLLPLEDDEGRKKLLEGLLNNPEVRGNARLTGKILDAFERNDDRNYTLDERQRAAYDRDAMANAVRIAASGQPPTDEQITGPIGRDGRGTAAANYLITHRADMARIAKEGASEAEAAQRRSDELADKAAGLAPTTEAEIGNAAATVVAEANRKKREGALAESIPGANTAAQEKYAAGRIAARQEGLTVERVRKFAADKGRPPNQKESEEIRRAAVREAALVEMEGLRRTDPKAPVAKTEEQVMKEEVETFLEKTRKNGGKPKVEFLPRRVLDTLRKPGTKTGAGGGLSDGLTRWGTMLDALRGPDGKPIFPEGNRLYIIKRMREDKADAPPDNRQAFRIPAGVLNGGTQIASAYNGLAGLGITPEEMGLEPLASVAPKTETVSVTVPAPKPGEDPTPKVTEKVATLPLRLADVPINTAAGAAIKPLNADKENLERTAAIQQGKEPLKANTPPLPQAPPEAPSMRVPLAMDSRVHPFVRSYLEASRRRKERGVSDRVAIPDHLWKQRGESGFMAPEGGSTAGYGGKAEKPSSVEYENSSGQPGLDVFFETKAFPAVLPGRVKEVGFQSGYGNFVVVESRDPVNGETVDVLYGHLGSARGGGVFVKEGQQISSGAVIGQQGSTGNVKSNDGTIASIDFLAPAPRGSGSMTPYRHFDRLRRDVGKGLQAGRFIGEPATGRKSGVMSHPLMQEISKHEAIGDSYDSVNTGGSAGGTVAHGSQIMEGLTRMTIRQVMAKQSARGLHAAGRWQIIGKTLKDVMERSRPKGISLDSPFSPETQDALMLALLRRRNPTASDLRNEWVGLKQVDSGRLQGLIDDFYRQYPS